MFLEEVSQAQGGSETSKIIIAAVALILTNMITLVVTYLLSRGKSKSEISKNEADAHKSEAETTKTNVGTIATLVDEIDEMLGVVRRLRKKVTGLEDRIDSIKDPLDKAIVLKALLIDDMVLAGLAQNFRMKAVAILEVLHSVRGKLRIDEDELNEPKNLDS